MREAVGSGAGQVGWPCPGEGFRTRLASVFSPEEVRGTATGVHWTDDLVGICVSLEVGYEVIITVSAGGTENQDERGFPCYSQIFVERLLCVRPGTGYVEKTLRR